MGTILEASWLETAGQALSDRGCAIGGYVWLPGAEEPTISITMPTTDKPLLRVRYRVKGEQKNEIGGVRRDNTRRGVRAYISVYGSHSLRLPLHRSVDRPRRRESRRALRSSAPPEIRGSPARHCDSLASPPSECRHVILLPRRAAAEIAHGSCQERVHQPSLSKKNPAT